MWNFDLIANCKGIYFLYSNVYVDKLLSVLLLRRKHLPVYSFRNHCIFCFVKKAKTVDLQQKKENSERFKNYG